MRNLKKILALALALVMTLSVMSVANAFTDKVETEAYAEAVDVLAGMGVFEGYEDGSFQAKGSITRAEVAAIIYRIVTGDVDDSQAKIYAAYAKFSDVKDTSWYAGYIGYCANAGYIQGYGNGKFGPNDNVTGYQALAMILRAMGYDQNGEFTGAEWVVNVASIAQQRGILKNVASANVLMQAATRELVAEILFQAIQCDTVIYTPALGYYTANLMGGVATTSLGYKTFGLSSTYGYITENQATGEKYTTLGELPAVKTDVTTKSWTLTLNTTTGLDQFGHYTKVWYNAKQTVGATVYASYDLGSSATVTSAEYAALKEKASYFSNSYGSIDQNSVVWDYNVLVTNPGNACDVLVRLNLDIAQYTAINRYTTYPYLTVNSGATNSTQSIYLNKATGYENVTLGSYVNVLTVTGTNLGANETYFQKQISALTGFTGVTVTYITKDGTVTLSTGETVKSSSATHKGYAATVAPAMDIRNGWNFGTTYNVYTDMFGNYVGAVVQTNNTYAKLVYAYYETDIVGGTITYSAQVVYNDGTTGTVQLDLTAADYNALTCTKLTWGGSKSYNSITAGESMDVVLTPAVKGYKIAHVKGDGHCAYIADAVANAGLTTIGRLNGSAEAWTVTKNTTTLIGNKNYFVDAATKFVVVSGYGATLKVESYTLAELVGTNASVTIPADSIVTASQLYSANIGSNNYHVDYVLIEGAVSTPVSQLIYVVADTGANAPAGDVYNVYFAGEAQQVVVSAAAGVTIKEETFYTYKLINGVYELQAEANGYGCIENYTVTTNYGTWYLYVNTADGKQMPITEAAKIINLTNVQNVPTTAAELAQAAAENNSITIDVEFDATGITVVYIVGYVAR